ncbi:hypothetical protein EV129_115105 [Rhizobium azibense]|uniref:Uncharacterized protein n=1 Tax=Rhizobium azibense TaxID=1136135 RepID=A0A4R3RDL3_9HYPH|nr:hypothetical protein EV129_115105 [Rhizobium azibense]
MKKERLAMFLFNTHPDDKKPQDPVGAGTLGIAEADEVERFSRTVTNHAETPLVASAWIGGADWGWCDPH